MSSHPTERHRPGIEMARAALERRQSMYGDAYRLLDTLLEQIDSPDAAQEPAYEELLASVGVPADNLEPSYEGQIAAAVEAKLVELERIPYGSASGRRFQMAGVDSAGNALTPAQHRDNSRRVMTDIANRLGLHFFQMTDAVRLDQLIAVSVVQNHDTAGLLRSLINSFLIVYTNKESTSQAYHCLLALEAVRTLVETDLKPSARSMH